MERRQVGVVKELFRYPVKSMLGELLSELDVGEQGVIGDRAYALREAGNGRVVTAKKWASMFEFRASYDAQPTADVLAPLRIILPDSRVIFAQDPNASTVLSSVLGRQVILERAQPHQHTRAEIDPLTVFGDVGVENVKPGMTAATMPDSFALPRGTFFDSAMIHVLASSTLSHMRRLIGEDAQLDPRRFRPNIVVDTDATAEGFVEDSWLEGTLEIGGGVKIIDMRAALRCVMTTHRQAELARDPRILRAAAQHHQANLGVFGAIGAPGKVRVGDPVMLVM
jgi:uncharacterized protein YcbX